MKYVIKKIFIGVAIGAILMFISNMYPKADTYHKENISNPVCNRGTNCNTFTTDMTYIIPASNTEANENVEINITPIDMTQFQGFKFTTYLSMFDTTYFTETYEYPDRWECNGSIGGATITYADGTHASISDYGTCTRWDVTSVASSSTTVGTPQTSGFAMQVGYRYNSGNGYQQCFIEASSENSITWNCPKTTNGGINTLSQLKFNIKHRNDNVSYLYINASAGIQLYNTSDNRIITNMNNLATNIMLNDNTNTQSIIDAINNGNTATQNAINANTQATQQQTQSITDSSTTGANSDADSLKNNTAFNDSSGISSLITLPLRFINNLGTSCTPINLTIPYMNANVSIPCMKALISSKMPALATLITAVVNGFLLYNIFIQIIGMIHGAKNPDDDRLEVVEL